MTAPPEADRAVGMEVYASMTPPCGAHVRSSSDDFRVEEALKELAIEKEPAPGYLPLYRVEKRSMDTFHLERVMAEALKSRISYAGMKDKRAAAVQFVTPTSTRSERPQSVERANFRAVLVGYVPRPISRPMVTGNRFTIVLRDCCAAIGECVAEVYSIAESRRLPNFYGLQRFGARDALTCHVGREMIRGRFDEAVRILLCEPRSMDDDATQAARRLISEGRYADGGRMLSPGQDIEKMVARHLAKKAGDFVGALRAVPIALRRLYTQAYQSYLFNRTLSLALKERLDISRIEPGDNWGETSSDGLNLGKVHGVKEQPSEGALPLVQLAGYAYRNYGSRFDRCLLEVMEGEGVAARDFYLQEMQEVSVEGGFRRPHLVARDATWDVSGSVATLAFTLPRGGYATVVLREIIKPGDPAGAGFA